jgi:hypothetical protein
MLSRGVRAPKHIGLLGLLLLVAGQGCSDDTATNPDTGPGVDTGADAAGCPSGTTLCGSECVHTERDPKHCGECDRACPAGQVCSAGDCAVECQQGLVNCGGACVDPQTDLMHCGASGDCQGSHAGEMCAAGEVCSAGTCAVSCQQGLVLCGGTCVDPLSSLAFCGASGDCQGTNAGTACASGEVCSAGTCAVSCQQGLVLCGGTCVDPLSDLSFCGATGDCQGANAGQTCAAGEVCSAGSCALSCQQGLLDCNGKCVDPQVSNLYCGATGDCQGGNAGQTCAAGEVCSAGSCALSCQQGLLNCNGICVDPQSDLSFCGATGDCQGGNAGQTCAAGEVCSGGSCALSCR